jgi:virginiamycin B lyase
MRRLPLIVVLGAWLVAAVLPSVAAARPEGAIRELAQPAHVEKLVPGPEGDLWFVGGGKPQSVGWMKPGGKPRSFKLPPKVEPLFLVVGDEGAGWFTYARGFTGFAGGGVGRITRAGKVTLFPEPPAAAGAPFEIVRGSDGNIWFDHAGIFETGGGSIGRITPSGEITEFGAGLNPGASLANLVAGEDGNVWFADESDAPAIGRITPAGEITEFPGLPPEEFSLIRGPSPAGPAGLWFAANVESGIALERIALDGTITSFRDGLSPRAELLGPFFGSPSGGAWFREQILPPGNKVSYGDGNVVIGHVTAAGRINEYSGCLRPTNYYSTARSFVNGPDGNVWFPVGRNRGRKGRSSQYLTPGIARVTPGGQITEFRYGLLPKSEPAEVTAAAGRVWFLDEHTDRIAELRPPRRAANTFLLETSAERGAITATVPGPGRLQVKESGLVVGSARFLAPGLSTGAVTAPGCGPVTVPVPVSARLRQHLQAKGHLLVGLRVTFTPRGGEAFSEPAQVVLKAK